MADAVSVVYGGAHAAVDVIDPQSGREVASNVERGQSIDVPEHVAKSLLESGQFKKPEPKAVAKKGDA